MLPVVHSDRVLLKTTFYFLLLGFYFSTMPTPQKLSGLVNEIDATIRNRFVGQAFWIKAEITDVKKQPDKRWCFLKFIEKDRNLITTEMGGVFWSNSYNQVENFEAATRQQFASGLEITCLVKVVFHKRFGMRLEVMEIDFAYEVGKLENERKQILERLVKEGIAVNPEGSSRYYTQNNTLELPMVFERIALIASANTDGYRDFRKVIENNKYGYHFSVTDFSTQIQGDAASALIVEQLHRIYKLKEQFDIVVIVRGGGSDTDFKSFNDFELAKAVALFPVPILTGIGHDRNTSITDLMARQHKTPTEVATFVIDHNGDFENAVMQLHDRILVASERLIDRARRSLDTYKRIIASSSPETIMNRGFAIIRSNGKIVVDAKDIAVGAQIETIMKQDTILSTVTQKQDNGNTNI